MKHRFGCTCAECTGRASERLRESQAIRQHNTVAGFRYTRPDARRSWAPRRDTVSLQGDMGDMHYRFDWMVTPKPGEVEYLNVPHWIRSTDDVT